MNSGKFGFANSDGGGSPALLIGSEDAAPHVADLYTVFERRRLSKVEPRAYLAYVIAALHTGGADPTTLAPTALASRFPRPR